MSYKKALTVRIEENIFEKTKIIAKENHRSMNSQIEYALDLLVKDYENKNGEIIIKEL